MIQAPYIKEDEQSHKAVETIKNTLLGKIVRISINDGRTFEGRFVCVDSEVNVILQGTYEYRSSNQAQNAEMANITIDSNARKRWAGMVMIPGQHITDVEVMQPRPLMTTNNAATTPGEAMYG